MMYQITGNWSSGKPLFSRLQVYSLLHFIRSCPCWELMPFIHYGRSHALPASFVSVFPAVDMIISCSFCTELTTFRAASILRFVLNTISFALFTLRAFLYCLYSFVIVFFACLFDYKLWFILSCPCWELISLCSSFWISYCLRRRCRALLYCLHPSGFVFSCRCGHKLHYTELPTSRAEMV